MFDFSFEPTVSEIMRDPMVRALMRADRVDARQFEARLRLMSRGGAGRGAASDGAGEADADVSERRFFPPAASRAAAERRCWG